MCFDPTKEICCNGHKDKLPKGATSAECCGHAAYNPTDTTHFHLCCENVLHTFSEKEKTMKCCGKEPYDSAKPKELCCNGKRETATKSKPSC